MGILQLQFGLAGSGKSEGIANEIAGEIRRQPLGSRIFWVVPGVASYTSERRLLERITGTVRAEIIHLNRLAARANEALHCVSGTPVNNTGKRLLLAAVYQEAVPELSVLGRVQPSMGILDAMMDVFEEMIQFAVSPTQIEAQLEIAATRFDGLNPEDAAVVSGQSLLGKLRDLSLLYVRYQRELTARNLYDPLALPSLVAPRLQEWAELKDATLYIDGLSDILPRDALFITQLARAARRTVVTLELPSTMEHAKGSGRTVGDSNDFYPLAPWLSFQRLTTLAEREGIDVEFTKAPLAPHNGRFRHAHDLAALECLVRGDAANLARADSKENAESPSHESQILLAGAQNIRAETDGVAARIAERQHQGLMNFADAAVLVPDMNDYAPHIMDSFRAYGIPYTIDEYPALIQHPVSKFVLACLLAVEADYSLEAMRRLIKTDFCGLTPAEADWLETYIMLYEVEGRQWFADTQWAFAQAEGDGGEKSSRNKLDERAETLRQKLLVWLSEFDRQAERDLEPAKLAHSLWNVWQITGVKSKVADWMASENTSQSMNRNDDALTQMNPLEGSLHEQAWLKWIALLDDLSETKVDKALPRDFLFSLIYEEIASQSLTTIPTGLEEVRVMTYDHAVAWEAEHLFVMGGTDGVLPKRVGHQGLLQDDEREQFHKLFGQPLGYTSKQRQDFERLQMYAVLTRGSSYLTLSAPLSNKEGKAVRPALLFQQIRDWFTGGVPYVLWTRQQAALAEVETTPGVKGEDLPRPARRMLEDIIPLLRSGGLSPTLVPVVRSLLADMTENEDIRTALIRSVQGLAHQTKASALSQTLAEKLYGNHLYSNVYQLETFAACSYRYFAQYGLRLKPEQLPDVTTAERGTLIHDTLQAYVEKQMNHQADNAQHSSEESAIQTLREVFDTVLMDPKAQLWQRKHFRLEQAREARVVLERAALVLNRHRRHSQFVPAKLELSFGDSAEDTLPPLTLPLGGNRQVSLRGRIDRIDVAQTAQEQVFRVVDYKSSELDLDITKIGYGLRLQLAVYGLAASVHHRFWSTGAVRLGGLFYFPVTTRLQVTAMPQTPAEALAEHFKRMRARGWMIEDKSTISAMDERLDTGTSDLFKKVYKNDGTLLKSAPVLSAREWDGLLGHVLQQVKGLSTRILDGEIQIQPYRLGNEDACTFCPYQPVCQIDRRWDASVYRKLNPIPREALVNWSEDGIVHEQSLQKGEGKA